MRTNPLENSECVSFDLDYVSLKETLQATYQEKANPAENF